ncbi:MAG: hypothetical protein NUV80_06555 [Candidatus Berkelbacteria bacterium]|nr:hypothetical protein [Candidatus Berkelbacteria bacterium]
MSNIVSNLPENIVEDEKAVLDIFDRPLTDMFNDRAVRELQQRLDRAQPARANPVSDHIISVLPRCLAELTLKTFGTKSNQAQVTYAQGTGKDGSYRVQGINSVVINYETELSFRSVNFGFCCGAQLLTDFNGKDTDFCAEYMKLWASLTCIPHFLILVKELHEDEWKWKYLVYNAVSKYAHLVKEWRNPMYNNHLLCLYELYNSEKYESFLNNTSPKALSIEY